MSTFSCICFLSLHPRNSWPCVLSIQIQGPFQRHRLPSSWPHYFFMQTVKRTLSSLRTVLFAKARILSEKKKKCYVVKGHSSLFQSALTLPSQLTIISFWNHKVWPCLYVTRALLVPHYEQSRRKGDQHWKLLTGDHGRTQPRTDSVQLPELYSKTHIYYSALPVSSLWREKTKMAFSLVLSVLTALKHKGT